MLYYEPATTFPFCAWPVYWKMTPMDLLSLGKEPVSETHPAGSDVRYEPEFEELQAEIDKLSNPSSSGSMDWERVHTLCVNILSDKSKDLLVASYLAVAQIHIHQMEGFGVGLAVYRDLLEQFWDDLFPSKKRMRGRTAAIEWWLEKVESAVEGVKAAPLPAERIEEFREHIRIIDAVLREKLDEAPLLRPLERIVEKIPIIAEKKPEPASKTEPTPGERTSAAETAPGRPAEVKREEAPAPSAPTEIDSAASAQKALDDAVNGIRRVCRYLQKEDLSNASAYRWMRIAAWAALTDPPPATDGKTIIPPPDPMVRTILLDLRVNKNWQGLVESAEDRVAEYILWLDLHRFVAEGLSNLGSSYQECHDVVCEETALFVRRLGGVENLSFADGTPFADAETLRWLQGIAFGDAGASTDMPSVADAKDAGHMTEVVEKAQALVKKKKLGEAVSMLDRELRRCFSKKGQLLWRLALAQLLLSAKRPKFALPHLEVVLQDVDAFRLEEWDPDLAFKGLKTVWLGLDAHGDDASKEQAASVLKRLARLSPTEAIGLERG